MAVVPELKSRQPPIFERLDSKGRATGRREEEFEQPPPTPDDLIQEGVGLAMHCSSLIGRRDRHLELREAFAQRSGGRPRSAQTSEQAIPLSRKQM